MIGFNIKYDELLEASKAHPPDEAYQLVLSNKAAWNNLDNIVAFVRRWDSRVPIRNNENSLKNSLLQVKDEFGALEKIGIENLEFNQQNVSNIKSIFKMLHDTTLQGTKRQVTLGSIGASKLMHGVNPNLFMMWDNGICDHYGCYPNETGYIHFMWLMQQEIREVLKEHPKEEMRKETGVSLPKLLDAYNWSKHSTSKSLKNK